MNRRGQTARPWHLACCPWCFCYGGEIISFYLSYNKFLLQNFSCQTSLSPFRPRSEPPTGQNHEIERNKAPIKILSDRFVDNDLKYGHSKSWIDWPTIVGVYRFQIQPQFRREPRLSRAPPHRSIESSKSRPNQNNGPNQVDRGRSSQWGRGFEGGGFPLPQERTTNSIKRRLSRKSKRDLVQLCFSAVLFDLFIKIMIDNFFIAALEHLNT